MFFFLGVSLYKYFDLPSEVRNYVAFFSMFALHTLIRLQFLSQLLFFLGKKEHFVSDANGNELQFLLSHAILVGHY